MTVIFGLVTENMTPEQRADLAETLDALDLEPERAVAHRIARALADPDMDVVVV